MLIDFSNCLFIYCRIAVESSWSLGCALLSRAVQITERASVPRCPRQAQQPGYNCDTWHVSAPIINIHCKISRAARQSERHGSCQLTAQAFCDSYVLAWRCSILNVIFTCHSWFNISTHKPGCLCGFWHWYTPSFTTLCPRSFAHSACAPFAYTRRHTPIFCVQSSSLKAFNETRFFKTKCSSSIFLNILVKVLF